MKSQMRIMKTRRDVSALASPQVWVYTNIMGFVDDFHLRTAHDNPRKQLEDVSSFGETKYNRGAIAVQSSGRLIWSHEPANLSAGRPTIRCSME